MDRSFILVEVTFDLHFSPLDVHRFEQFITCWIHAIYTERMQCYELPEFKLLLLAASTTVSFNMLDILDEDILRTLVNDIRYHLSPPVFHAPFTRVDIDIRKVGCIFFFSFFDFLTCKNSWSDFTFLGFFTDRLRLHLTAIKLICHFYSRVLTLT